MARVVPRVFPGPFGVILIRKHIGREHRLETRQGR